VWRLRRSVEAQEEGECGEARQGVEAQEEEVEAQEEGGGSGRSLRVWRLRRERWRSGGGRAEAQKERELRRVFPPPRAAVALCRPCGPPKRLRREPPRSSLASLPGFCCSLPLQSILRFVLPLLLACME